MFERIFKTKLISVNDSQRLLNAIADRIKKEFDMMISDIDSNKDDYISMGELIKFIKQVFKSVIRMVK